MPNPSPPSLDMLVPGIQAILDAPPALPTPEPEAASEKFLRFAIATGQQMLLPLTAIIEVQRLSLVDVLPVPLVPTWVLGLHHSRGEIVWVVDLGHLMGEALRYQPGQGIRQSQLILLEVNGQQLGLAVAVIYDIEVYSVNQFQMPQPGVLLPSLERLVSGYMCDSDLIVLDPQRLLQRDILSPRVEAAQPFPF